jgi:hypothetical protein
MLKWFPSQNFRRPEKDLTAYRLSCRISYKKFKRAVTRLPVRLKALSRESPELRAHSSKTAL